MEPNTARFIPLAELALLRGCKPKTIQNEFSGGRGPMKDILTKLGGRVGAWSPDYDAWVARQRNVGDKHAA